MRAPVNGFYKIQFSKIGGHQLSRPLYAVMVFVSKISLTQFHLHAADNEFVQLDVVKVSLRLCARLATFILDD